MVKAAQSQEATLSVVTSTEKNIAGIPGCQRDQILLSACPAPSHAFVRQTGVRHYHTLFGLLLLKQIQQLDTTNSPSDKVQSYVSPSPSPQPYCPVIDSM